MPIDQVDYEKAIRKLVSAKEEFVNLFFEERSGTTIVYVKVRWIKSVRES